MKIIANNLEKSFGSLHVLKGIDLELISGQLVVLLGPSGCGKSTLLNILSGLLAPDIGKVECDGTSLYGGMHERQFSAFRSQHFSHIFQQFHLLPHLTAMENARLPLEFRKAGDVDNKTLAALATVGLSERLEHFPHELSRGECQRLAIARSLTINPKFLFADEPSASLDPNNADAIFRLLKNLTRDHGCNVLAVTHDWGMTKYADMTYQMRDGKLYANPISN